MWVSCVCVEVYEPAAIADGAAATAVTVDIVLEFCCN